MAALCMVKTIACILGNHIFCWPRFLLPSRLGTFKRQSLYLLYFSCLWHMLSTHVDGESVACCTLCWVNEEDMVPTPQRA